ncbi:hypothetical protein Agub_g3538 [Astrephomene gubernaculifera]|uniref:Major facilitator superfamily (MFS) profile domain-containing protein n=1 Tax=Astrephomene gubernaculifera TaxID=47775 RepID=A0AAD3HJ13_9CHLO|nr:hypothetical protein Agub_g3538 [Astrephomene gubernaculifera]
MVHHSNDSDASSGRDKRRRRFLGFPLPSHSVTAYQLVVYTNVVLYSICWMAQVPVLPYLVEKLGAAGSTQYGRLQTAFSALQFIGGLISGPLMDRYGPRFLFALSFAASLSSYALTATATSMGGLYLARLPTIMQHAVLAARAIVTQLSSDSDRARVLGFVAVSYSVGFTLGPAVGGWLGGSGGGGSGGGGGEWLQGPAVAAAVGSAVSLVSVLLLLPDLPPPGSPHPHPHPSGHPPPHHSAAGDAPTAASCSSGAAEDPNTAATAAAKAAAAAATAQEEEGTGADGGSKEREAGAAARERAAGGVGARQMMLAFVEVSRRPGVRPLLLGKLLVGLGSAVFQSMFPVLLKRQYGLDPRHNGLVMSYVGGLLLAGQALLVGPVISTLGEPATERSCVAALAATFLALAASITSASSSSSSSLVASLSSSAAAAGVGAAGAAGGVAAGAAAGAAAWGSLWQLLVLMVPYSVAGMLYNNASTSRLTKAVLPQQRGTALSLDMSLSSGVRMLAPALGAAAADSYGSMAVPALSAVLTGAFLLAMQLRLVEIPVAEVGGKQKKEGGDEGKQEGVAEGGKEGMTAVGRWGLLRRWGPK